jgi:molybdate transport system substrate-binding protein
MMRPILKAAAIAVLGFCFIQEAAAQTAPVHALVSNGVRAVVEELRPQCERSGGRPLALQFGSTAGLRQKIDAGEAFDALVLTTPAIEDLIKQGKAAGPATRVARAGIGVGIRSGAAKPDISTADAMKQTLLAAKSITYVGDGASRVYIEKMSADLGITDRMKPKTILQPDIEKSIADVASGKAELWITLMSEIMPAKGITLIGPLPQQFQNYVNFSAALSAKPANAAAGKSFVTCVTASSADATLKAKGLERVK